MLLDEVKCVLGGNMMVIEKTVSLDRCRIELIDNRKTKYSFSKIWSMYGGDNKVLINGPFFNMNTKLPVVHTKINGKTLCAPKYTVGGIGWKKDTCPDWFTLPTPNVSNYFTNTVLVEDGYRYLLTAHTDSDGTKRNPRFAARPAIGFSSDGLKIYFGTSESLWGLQDKLFRRKWKYAIMLDGGASAAYRDKEHRISPKRMIPYWILVTIIDNEPKGGKPVTPVYHYSLKKDGSKSLSKNFKVREFKSFDGTDTIFVAPELVDVLQKVRDRLGKPLVINSAYRTETQNKKVGGATYSQHKYGTAADVCASGVKPEKIKAIAEEILGDSGGIGLYRWGVHIDVREKKARWNG